MPPVFTPYILSCDDMFIIDATNEAGDTESYEKARRLVFEPFKDDD